MKFFINKEKKIILYWSAKCGCSHIKKIWWYLNNCDKNDVHDHKYNHKYLPNNIKDYTTIIIIRNPYKRIISGFLDKYNKNGQFIHKWKYSSLTFSKFVDEVIKNNWKMIDKHHFTQQTTEEFDNKIFLSKVVKFYDIKNIDYEYIEKLFNKKITEYIKNWKGNHTRNNVNINIKLKKYIYDLDILEYYNYKINIKYFYNEEIKKKIFNFYKNMYVLD